MEQEFSSGEIIQVPVCQICKAQDETLRVVSLPFVISVIFMTFQRAFSGVYCRKHRRRYHVFASFITSTLGWLGIPFGFIFTPITLFNLAAGGKIDPKMNFDLLNRIAQKKLLTGDMPGAIRCLEESLQFDNNPDVRQKLQRLYQTNPSQTGAGSSALKLFFSVVGVVSASILAGLFTGTLDVVLGYLLGSFYGASDSIFTAILSWIPITTAMFFGILWIRSLTGSVFRNEGKTSSTFVAAISLVASSLFFYGIMEVQSILWNIFRLMNAFSYSAEDGFFALRSILLTGGVNLLVADIKYSQLTGFILLGLLLAGFGLCLYSCIQAGLQNQKWQSRLLEIRNSVAAPETEISPLWAWLPLGGLFFALILSALLLYPGKLINVQDAFNHAEQGMNSLDEYMYKEALGEFKTSSAIWQDSVMTHVNLSLGYASLDQYDQALAEVQAARELAPDSTATNLVSGLLQTYMGNYSDAITDMKTVVEQKPVFGFAHAILANLYYQVDQIEMSEQEIRIALANAEGDSQTNSMIASYYFQRREFVKAEYHTLEAIKLENDPQEYLSLSRIYLYQNKILQAQQAIDQAEELGGEPVEIYLAKSNLAQYKSDLAGSQSLLMAALEKYPDNSDLLADLSFAHFQMDRIDMAIQEAEQAIELNPHNSIAYVELAYAYEKQGRFEEALSAAQKGAALMPKYDRSHYILGLCYMNAGMEEESIREFESFLELYIDRIYVREDKNRAEEYLLQLK